jgi:hypothetical protein
MQLTPEQIEKAHRFLEKLASQEGVVPERIQIALAEFDLSELDYFTLLSVEEICKQFIEFTENIADEEVADYKVRGDSMYTRVKL